jgi:hypothetical protein
LVVLVCLSSSCIPWWMEWQNHAALSSSCINLLSQFECIWVHINLEHRGSCFGSVINHY